MEENQENKENRKKKSIEDHLIYRKSLLKGQSKNIAADNVNLRNNIRKIVKNFLKGNDSN